MSRQPRRRLIVAEVPECNWLTFVFNEKEMNDDFNAFLSSTKINPDSLRGMLIYNVLALPAFCCYHYHHFVGLKQSYSAMSHVFLCTVLMVHSSFFALYYFEQKKTNDEKKHRVNATRREWTMNLFIILSLCACGLVMVAELPLVTYNKFFYKYVNGNIAVEPFIISLLLNVYHHSLLPVHWGVIMLAWFLQLLLIIYSWFSTAMRQTFVTNMVLIILYIAMVFVNKAIHESKIQAFLVDRDSNVQQNKWASSYLDQLAKPYINEGDHDDSVSKTFLSSSSDAVSSLTGYHIVNDDMSTITFASAQHASNGVDEVKARSRQGKHLAKEKSLFS